MTRNVQSHLAMLGFSVLVAGSFSLGSIIANDISPIALTAVRFILAAIVIGIIAISTGSVTQAALKSPCRYLVLGGIFSHFEGTIIRQDRLGTKKTLGNVDKPACLQAKAPHWKRPSGAKSTAKRRALTRPASSEARRI